jgi:hypothetical protein
MTRDPLQEALLAAHAIDDRRALVALYRDAADLAYSAQDIDRECFFLTHAWIFALETDHELVHELFARLDRNGRV